MIKCDSRILPFSIVVKSVFLNSNVVINTLLKLKLDVINNFFNLSVEINMLLKINA